MANNVSSIENLEARREAVFLSLKDLHFLPFTECTEKTTHSVLDNCKKFATTEADLEILASNVRRLSNEACRDFMYSLPYWWNPRTVEGVSKILFARILPIERRGDYSVLCRNLMQPLPFSKLQPQNVSREENPSFFYALLTVGIGGLFCYLLGPARAMNSLRKLRFA